MLQEFCRRVAEREERDISSAIALQHASVVLQVVLGSVSSGERDDVIAQLPAEYIETLLER